MKYKVRETYTPDDPDADRRRQEAEFESDSTDLVELAFLAKKAIHSLNESLADGAWCVAIRYAMEHSDVADQVADQEASAFEFLMFGNSGEWATTVEAEN